jgi:malate dehydrogenase
MVGIISNPVNSTVPIFCETLKKAGKLNPKRIFGTQAALLWHLIFVIAPYKGLEFIIQAQFFSLH